MSEDRRGRLLRLGQPDSGSLRSAPKRRAGPCWLWNSGIRPDGYGMVTVGKTSTPAPRWVYVRLRGSIPEGLELDHLCRNRRCVNPWHLEPVTHAENIRRGRGNGRAEMTHCKNGHPFNETNTIHRNGTRRCRVCRAAYYRQPGGRGPYKHIAALLAALEGK